MSSDSAAGLDLRNLDIEALKKKSETIKIDKGVGSSEYKAEAWRQLALDVPQFADKANERAAEWADFAAQQKAILDAKQKRTEARDADWGKLAELLALDEAVVPQTSKASWSGDFSKAYMSSPGLTPAMAKALSAHMAEGALKLPIEKEAAAPPRAGADGESRDTVGADSWWKICDGREVCRRRRPTAARGHGPDFPDVQNLGDEQAI